jgi:hypothetical protein
VTAVRTVRLAASGATSRAMSLPGPLAALLAGAVLTAACAGDAPGRRDSAASRAGPAATATPASASLAVRRAQRSDARGVSLTIDSAGIGPVLLGVRVATLASRCAVTDTALTISEGMMERAHVATVAGHTAIALSTGTPDTSVIRVIVTDPAFRTTGGVGVGSSVQALRLAHGPLCAAQGEGNFVVSSAGMPGVSFAIDWNPPASREPAAMETPFPGGDPGTALDASRIIKVWVHGVTGGCRVGVG